MVLLVLAAGYLAALLLAAVWAVIERTRSALSKPALANREPAQLDQLAPVSEPADPAVSRTRATAVRIDAT